MQPTEDERVLAALSHASIVANIFSLAGMLATALIWTTRGERSRYVRAHALQSLAYQAAVLVLGILLVMFWGLCMVLSLLPVFLKPELYYFTNPPRSFWLALLGLLLPIGFVVAATLYGLYGAYRVYRGRPFRYPLIGRLVRRDLAAVLPATARAPAPAPDVTPPAAGVSAASAPDTIAPVATAPAPDVAPPGVSEPAEAPPGSAGDDNTPPAEAPAAAPAARRARRRPPEDRE